MMKGACQAPFFFGMDKARSEKALLDSDYSEIFSTAFKDFSTTFLGKVT